MRKPNVDPERRLYALVAVAALVVIYVVAFIVSNAASVKLSFVVFDASLSLIILMVGCLLIGFGLGILATRVTARRRRGRTSEATPGADPDATPYAS